MHESQVALGFDGQEFMWIVYDKWKKILFATLSKHVSRNDESASRVVRIVCVFLKFGLVPIQGKLQSLRFGI
jgi:hypothetical protein